MFKGRHLDMAIRLKKDEPEKYGEIKTFVLARKLFLEDTEVSESEKQNGNGSSGEKKGPGRPRMFDRDAIAAEVLPHFTGEFQGKQAIFAALGRELPANQWGLAIKTLLEQKAIVQTGNKRSAAYALAGTKPAKNGKSKAKGDSKKKKGKPTDKAKAPKGKKATKMEPEAPVTESQVSEVDVVTVS